MITRFIFSFFAGIFNLILGFLIIGGLVAGALFWSMVRDLPSYDDLKRYNPPTLSQVYAVSGKLLDEYAQERRIFAPIESVPDLMKFAFVSAEDKNFYNHEGYDIAAIGSAIIDAVESGGEDVRGASTITQQVMKNFLLTNEKTVKRKVQEIVLAHRVESALDKDQILELYLNEIFLGQNSYGVTAAALTYFNKPLSELGLHEIAFIASLPQSPSTLGSNANREKALSRRNYVLKEMFQNGYITSRQMTEAFKENLRTVQSGDIESHKKDIPARDYFTDEIRRQVTQSLGESALLRGGLKINATLDNELQEAARTSLRNGLLSLDRQAGVWRGTGLTAIPKDVQREASWAEALKDLDLVRDMPGWTPATVIRFDNQGAFVAVENRGQISIGYIPASEAKNWPRHMKSNEDRAERTSTLSDLIVSGDVIYVEAGTGEHEGRPIWQLRQVPAVEGAFMAVDVDTGQVLAMQGGFSFEKSRFNRATQAMRQTGSSFKPFLYASAFERGLNAASMFDDVSKTIRVGNESWTPKNASGRSYGRVSARVGIERSLNLLTLDIGQTIGMEAIAEMSERLGVYSSMKLFPANMLGSQETTLFNMVRAYAVFASGGERVDLSLVSSIEDSSGNLIFEHSPARSVDTPSSQISTEDDSIEAAISSVLEDEKRIEMVPRPRLMNEVTAFQITDVLEGVVKNGTARRVQLPVPIAGKTGTTNLAKDVWFIGYTPRIVAGCFVGFDNPTPLGTGAGGGTICGPIFQEFMETALKKYPSGEFQEPKTGHYAFFNNGKEVPYETSVREFVPNVVTVPETVDINENINIPFPSESQPVQNFGSPAAPIVTPGGGVFPQQTREQRFQGLGTGGLY